MSVEHTGEWSSMKKGKRCPMLNSQDLPGKNSLKALQSVMRSNRGPLGSCTKQSIIKNFQDISLGDLQNAQAAYEKLSQRYGSVKEWTRHFDDAVDGLRRSILKKEKVKKGAPKA